MNKKTLKTLGALNRTLETTFNAWIKSHYADKEIELKLNLFKKIMKCLEEQKRGFMKSKINYQGMADYINENADKPFTEIQAEVTKIALTK